MRLDKFGKILIGLTGNIASGKSLVLSLFDDRLFEKVDSDKIAQKYLMRLKAQDLPPILREKDIFNKDGGIDREKLSRIAFSNKTIMRGIEKIIHPLVIKEIEDILRLTKKRFAIVESAILFENKMTGLFNRIVTVFAPIEIRAKRLMKRTKIDYKEALKRIRFQMGESTKILQSDFVIENSRDKRWLIRQVRNIEEHLNRLYSE